MNEEKNRNEYDMLLIVDNQSYVSPTACSIDFNEVNKHISIMYFNVYSSKARDSHGVAFIIS